MSEPIETFPRRFGPYVLLQPLGRGGMGQATLAMTGQPGCERLCVVKRVLPQLRQDSDYLHRFHEESELARRLSHANLVETYAVGDVEGEPFIAQAFVDGCDLTELCNRCGPGNDPLPTAVAVYIIRELARGLAYAHDFDGLNLVHRDIDPPDVRLTFGGEVKLLDFGLAHSTVKSAALLSPADRWGKAAYLAPEQLSNGPVDRRTDVYVLGVLLWELLAGQLFGTAIKDGRPHYEGEPGQGGSKTVLPPSSFNPEVPPELDAVVLKTIARQPASRFVDATELRAALARFIPSDCSPEELAAALVKQHFFSEVACNARRQMITDARHLLRPAPVPADAGAADVSLGNAPRYDGAICQPEDEESTQRLLRMATTRRLRVVALFTGGAVLAAVMVLLLGAGRPEPTTSTAVPAETPATHAPVTPSARAGGDRTPIPQAAPLPQPEAPIAPTAEEGAPVPEGVLRPAQGPRAARRGASVPSPSRSAVLLREGRADALAHANEAFRSGDLDRALREAERAARLGAGTEALIIIGNVRLKQGNYAAAERSYGEAARFEPTNQTAAERLAKVRELMRAARQARATQ